MIYYQPVLVMDKPEYTTGIHGSDIIIPETSEHKETMCSECGAKTIEEASLECIHFGDNDYCEGCDIWGG